MLDAGFADRGWAKIAHAPDIWAWAEAAREDARRAVVAPENAHWHQCEGTWFVGVDVLGNDSTGDLRGVLFPDTLRAVLGEMPGAKPFHPAQVSVVYPGYPKPRAGEGDGAFRYRRNRDAAHVDGLLPVGPERRRMLREPHAFVLGVPLTNNAPNAAPMVIWEGSHKVMQKAFAEALAGTDPSEWADTDLTEPYHQARRLVFETCKRVCVHAAPGEAYIVHRLALHGVAPWAADAYGSKDGRMVAYLRPELSKIENWPRAD